MWLWYLELYVATLAAFALGAVVALVVVRLVVRRTADDPSAAAPGEAGGKAAPAGTTGATP